MAIDDNESCGSRAMEPSSPKHIWQQRQRFEVFSEVLSRLRDLNLDDVNLPGFEDQLWLHFSRLPARFDFINPRFCIYTNIYKLVHVYSLFYLFYLYRHSARGAQRCEFYQIFLLGLNLGGLCCFALVACRYVSDVNVERAEDVLMHKRLLNLAEDPDNRPAFEVRLVQVPTQACISYCYSEMVYYVHCDCLIVLRTTFRQ